MFISEERRKLIDAKLSRTRTAEIVIYLPGEGDFNPVSGVWSGGSTLVWEGPARVQPLRVAQPRTAPGDTERTQQFLFSLPYEALDVDLTEGMMLRVTKSPENPSLLSFVWSLYEVLDSSNPVERTIYGVTDQRPHDWADFNV